MLVTTVMVGQLVRTNRPVLIANAAYGGFVPKIWSVCDVPEVPMPIALRLEASFEVGTQYYGLRVFERPGDEVQDLALLGSEFSNPGDSAHSPKITVPSGQESTFRGDCLT